MSLTRKLLVSAIFLLEALGIYFFLTQRYPISGDDYSYLYQAKLFASGKLYAQGPLYDSKLPFYDCVETFCLRDNRGHRFSKYPPGWPILLAAGVALRAPWLINPILGALLVFALLEYTERRISKEHVKITCLLLMLCFFFCYYAAAYRAHIAAAVFIFAAFLLDDYVGQRPKASKFWLFCAGALLGYSAMIRYIDWIPLGTWISVRFLCRKQFANLMLFAAGFGLFASGNLVYDALMSGDPFKVPAAINLSSGFSDRLIISWSGFVVTTVRLENLLWVFPPTLLLVALWRRYQPSARAKMCTTLFAMAVAIYFFYPASAGGPGPRYFLAYFPFLILATTELCGRICHDPAPAVRGFWNLAILSLILGSLVFATKEGYTMYWRRDLERTAQNANNGKRIILLKTGTYKTAKGDLTRNPPVIDAADTLYFALCDEPGRSALLKRFPDRNVFVYEYPGHLTSLSRVP